jgi:solute carrier family 13 (sodium-dependent dicarboxylate transporter), member 2/3/5
MPEHAPNSIFAYRPFASWHDFVGPLTTNFPLLLGPLIGCAFWLIPTGLEPVQQKTFAIIAFMIVNWLVEPIDHGVTALIGCYLFWALDVVKFSVAFSGYVNATVWFQFGSLLMAEAAARTGLANRLGCLLLRHAGSSYRSLLLGMISLSYLLTVFVPSGIGRLAILAPLAAGVVKASGAGVGSNFARGLFVILTTLAALSDVMILSGATSMMTRGILEEQTGIQLLWSQWFLAFLPLSVTTIFLAVIIVQRLYPVTASTSLPGESFFTATLTQMGPWTSAEKKALGWFLVAVALWASDSIHHINPAIVGVGVALALCFPRIGVLDAKAIKQVNFLVMAFAAGAISMGNVLLASKSLPLLTEPLITWMQPLFSNVLSYTATLYVGGFLYHFLFANRQSMLITSLPLLLALGSENDFNLIALALLWTFGGGGGLFVYQSGVYVIGYSYGYFTAKDFLKVGLILTVVEGVLLLLLVRFYWPLIGLNWMK